MTTNHASDAGGVVTSLGRPTTSEARRPTPRPWSPLARACRPIGRGRIAATRPKGDVRLGGVVDGLLHGPDGGPSRIEAA